MMPKRSIFIENENDQIRENDKNNKANSWLANENDKTNVQLVNTQLSNSQLGTIQLINSWLMMLAL